MNKIFKIVILVIIILIGLSNAFFTIDAILMDQKNVILYPFLLFLISIPSIVFQYKTLKIVSGKRRTNSDLLDNTAVLTSAPKKHEKIELIYWIGNLLLGIFFVGVGLYISIKLMINHPYEIQGFIISTIFILFGIFILLDEWKVKQKMKTKQL